MLKSEFYTKYSKARLDDIYKLAFHTRDIKVLEKHIALMLRYISAHKNVFDRNYGDPDVQCQSQEMITHFEFWESQFRCAMDDLYDDIGGE
tara:strand:+ start:1187 stop:1459 length:273 start_codon:yes stop_codon:yes gene_type:complete